MKQEMKRIALLALTTLLIMGCKNNQNPAQQHANGLPKVAAEGSATAKGEIAYVEVDSLSKQYKFCTDQQEILKRKQADFSAKLEKEGAALQKTMTSLQQKMQSGKITSQQEAQQAQATVQQMQTNLTRHQQQYEEAMTKATQAYQKELRKRINDYFTEYNKDGRYSMILTNSEATINVLYAAPGSDITKEVIEGLNKAYKK